MAHILDSPISKWKKTKSEMQQQTLRMAKCNSRCNTRECSGTNTIPPLYFRYERIPTNNSNYCIFNDDNTQQTVDSIQKWAKQNKMRLNIDKTKHMVINQTTAGPTNITINNNNLEQVENYKYLGSILNDKLDYDEQWEKKAKTTNCHIYLIKQLKRMGFKEEMNIYRSITLSQYLYNALLLGSASTQAKKEMDKQQHRFFNVIGITST